MCSGSCAAAPFVPADDAVVLQTGLPNADPRMQQIRELSEQRKKRPSDRELAMRLSARQLAMGVAESDPRFVGNAQATLAAWWREGAPPSLVLLRARILQARHNFADAVRDLHLVLDADPDNLQALIVLATVDEVTGDLAEAQSACDRVARLDSGLVAATCLASIGSITGHAAKTAAALGEAIGRAWSRDTTIQLWALTIRGEIGMRIGDPAAEEYFKEALALNRRDVYALTTYSDYLLDQGRAAEVIKLLAGFERIDALYLRVALAAQATDDPNVDTLREDLAARFAAARLQGDTLHLRDAARFALDLEHDPQRALRFAQQNWEIQKTPTDARILLDAAVASKSREAARPVAEWVSATHLEDRTLSRLIQRLGL